MWLVNCNGDTINLATGQSIVIVPDEKRGQQTVTLKAAGTPHDKNTPEDVPLRNFQPEQAQEMDDFLQRLKARLDAVPVEDL